MSKVEYPLSFIKNYLPENCDGVIIEYLLRYKVELSITKPRKSILGNYKYTKNFLSEKHKISINGNLNKYAFLITFLHELAHLIAFQRYGLRILPHGKEWKNIFADLLVVFLQRNIFPEDIKQTLLASLNNLSASSCADIALVKVLKNYDSIPNRLVILDDLEDNSIFIYNKKAYLKRKKRRTRIECIELETERCYLFSSVAEVEPLAS